MPAQSAHRAVSARAGIAILGSTVAASLLVCAGIVTAANSVPVFVWSFDANLAQGAPDLLAMAQRNPDLHRAMVERRAHAYAAGGWDQANVALSTFLERKFAVYADDAALRSLASAHVDALTYLQGDPARCKSVGLAPRIDREGEPAPAMTAMIRAAWAAIRSGANAQQAGATMTAPTPATDWAMLRNGHNPPSLEEVAVLTSNSGAEPALYCRAAIKVLDNIFYLPADDIARVYRLFLLHADEGNWVADVERSRPK